MAKSKRYYNLIDVEPKGYISEVGSHRYSLTFKTKKDHHGKSAAVIQMNCAKAGPTGNKTNWNSDSTIGKVLSWCFENDNHPFEIVHCLNLFSYVDPKPNNLGKLSFDELNNSKNDERIIDVCRNVDYIILAYGDCDGIESTIVKKRVKQVLEWLEKYDLYNVGELTTKGGNPRHGRAWNKNPKLNVLKLSSK